MPRIDDVIARLARGMMMIVVAVVGVTVIVGVRMGLGVSVAMRVAVVVMMIVVLSMVLMFGLALRKLVDGRVRRRYVPPIAP